MWKLTQDLTSSHALISSVRFSRVTAHLVARGVNPSLCIFCLERCGPLCGTLQPHVANGECRSQDIAVPRSRQVGGSSSAQLQLRPLQGLFTTVILGHAILGRGPRTPPPPTSGNCCSVCSLTPPRVRKPERPFHMTYVALPSKSQLLGTACTKRLREEPNSTMVLGSLCPGPRP